jgi:hypothetical protein
MNALVSLSGRQLLLLAPEGRHPDNGFGRFRIDGSRYGRLLANMQRLRGRIYHEDGAINTWDLTSDGRHVQSMDRHSWHVLLVDPRDRVYGCARYLPFDFDVEFSQLGVSRSQLASSDVWRPKLKRAVEAERRLAVDRGLSLVEVGGWALAEEMRHGTEALKIALAMYSLAQALGGCIGLTTATVRHCSSAILRKIGGRPLEVDGCRIPGYFDYRYNCDMEILRFDSSAPNPKYLPWMERVGAELTSMAIVGWFRPESLAAGAVARAGSDTASLPLLPPVLVS